PLGRSGVCGSGALRLPTRGHGRVWHSTFVAGLKAAGTSRRRGNRETGRSDGSHRNATLSDLGDEAEPDAADAACGGDAVHDVALRAMLPDTEMTILDVGFVTTSSCTSSITYIDAGEGILRHRGYPIEQLAEKSSFLEVAYLLNYGEDPTQAQLAEFTGKVMG